MSDGAGDAFELLLKFGDVSAICAFLFPLWIIRRWRHEERIFAPHLQLVVAEKIDGHEHGGEDRADHGERHEASFGIFFLIDFFTLLGGFRRKRRLCGHRRRFGEADGLLELDGGLG